MLRKEATDVIEAKGAWPWAGSVLTKKQSFIRAPDTPFIIKDNKKTVLKMDKKLCPIE